MKLGAEGFIAYDKVSGGISKSQSFPLYQLILLMSLAEILFYVMSTGISTENNFMSAAAIACCMSAIAVENMGNIPIESKQLKNFYLIFSNPINQNFLCLKINF